MAFLHEGAQSHDRLLYVGAASAAELVDELAALPDRDDLLASRQLVALPLTRLFAAGQGGALAWLRAAGESATAAGHRALRIAGDVTTVISEPAAGQRHAGHELLMDAVAAISPLTLLCGYDTTRTSPASQRAVQFVHPLRVEARPPVLPTLFADEGRWRLAGEVDCDVVDLVTMAVATLPHDRDLVLDVRGLTFIDVAGVRALIAVAQAMVPPHHLVLDGANRLLVMMLSLWNPVPRIHVVPS